MINQPLYELTNTRELKPLARHLYTTQHLIFNIQKTWATIAPQTKRKVKEFLKQKGADTYVLTVTDHEYRGGTRFFTKVGDVLKETQEGWMCVGEMGFRLMEREEIIDGIKHACKKNGADIKIVHGPRIDPRTHRVLELAREGKVKLFPLENYPSSHFLYLVSTTGKSYLIEESPHAEPVRAKDKEGKIVEFYRSLHRVFYFIPNPNWLGRLRLKQAQHRVWKSQQRRYPRISSKERGYPLFGILLSMLFYFIPYTFFIQPLIVLFDRLAASWANLFKKSGSSMIWGANGKRVRVEKMNQEISKAKHTGGQNHEKPPPKEANIPIEQVPVEELTRLIRESSDLAIRINATHELVRRAESG